jgi:hypothetical protein
MDSCSVIEQDSFCLLLETVIAGQVDLLFLSEIPVYGFVGPELLVRAMLISKMIGFVVLILP